MFSFFSVHFFSLMTRRENRSNLPIDMSLKISIISMGEIVRICDEKYPKEPKKNNRSSTKNGERRLPVRQFCFLLYLCHRINIFFSMHVQCVCVFFIYAQSWRVYIYFSHTMHKHRYVRTHLHSSTANEREKRMDDQLNKVIGRKIFILRSIWVSLDIHHRREND